MVQVTPHSPRSVLEHVVTVVSLEDDEKSMTTVLPEQVPSVCPVEDDDEEDHLLATTVTTSTLLKKRKRSHNNNNNNSNQQQQQEQEENTAATTRRSNSSRTVRFSSEPPQRITWRDPERNLSESQVMHLRSKLWYTRADYSSFSEDRVQTLRRLRMLRMQRRMQHSNMMFSSFSSSRQQQRQQQQQPMWLDPAAVVVSSDEEEAAGASDAAVPLAAREARRSPPPSICTLEEQPEKTMSSSSSEIGKEEKKSNSSKNKDKDDDFCLRGLEAHMLSRQQSAQVKAYRQMYMQTILHEQALLHKEQQRYPSKKRSWDFERMHVQVDHLSSWALERAQERAQSDPDEEILIYGGVIPPKMVMMSPMGSSGSSSRHHQQQRHQQQQQYRLMRRRPVPSSSSSSRRYMSRVSQPLPPVSLPFRGTPFIPTAERQASPNKRRRVGKEVPPPPSPLVIDVDRTASPTMEHEVNKKVDTTPPQSPPPQMYKDMQQLSYPSWSSPPPSCYYDNAAYYYHSPPPPPPPSDMSLYGLMRAGAGARSYAVPSREWSPQQHHPMMTTMVPPQAHSQFWYMYGGPQPQQYMMHHPHQHSYHH